MKYLPFEDFEIHTTLSRDEIYYRLCAAVKAERKWLIFSNKLFWGDVYRHYFRIGRNTWWNYNFTPVVSGNIDPEELGCCVRIKMRMPWLSFLFYSFAFGFIWLSFFISMANLVVQRVKTAV